MYPVVKIKNDRVASIKRKHPWVFSRGVLEAQDCSDGDIVEVQSLNGEFQAIAYYQDGSIMLRVLSFEKIKIDLNYWIRVVKKALHLRVGLGFPSKNTNTYRLFHGEGDGVSGLIIDIYESIAVIQCHTIGIYKNLQEIAKAITYNMKEIDTIYCKSANTLPKDFAAEIEDHFILGDKGETNVHENGNSFLVDIVNSQKTGFFLDQRDNRQLLSQYAEGKKILNLFCYTGGFSIYALNNEASKVCSVDSSNKAIEMLDRNVKLTGRSDRHFSFAEDVNQYLKKTDGDFFDIIVVDPPAFAKSIRKKHNAVQAYKRVNKAAIEKVKAGGMVFTYSCSQVIDLKLFKDTVTAAAIESGRNCQILFQMSQGADHPVNIFHPEGKYLKGLVLAVSD